MTITLDAHPADAPCCIKILAADGRDVLVQLDWDYPGVARAFGWPGACRCGHSDGTVNCACASAHEQIAAAWEWIDAHDGATADDPGYFEE